MRFEVATLGLTPVRPFEVVPEMPRDELWQAVAR